MVRNYQKTLIAVQRKKIIVPFVIIFGTLSFAMPIPLCLQLPTPADNVALPAFAAARRAAAAPGVQQSIDISYPPGPQQQTRSNKVRRPDGTDRQTDGRRPNSHTDAAPRTTWAVPKYRAGDYNTHARTHAHTHTRLTALFRDYPGGPVPER